MKPCTPATAARQARARWRPIAAALALLPLQALGHPGHLGSVEVTGHYDNTVGSSDAASAGVIGPGLLSSRALSRAGDVLEFVPGLVVTQHAGNGKANQYFLRGFNIDHGTDFATRIDGVPVNLPTHGHGQGYADINFLIPELVQRIDYRKGPYDAASGDFSSAGSADIRDRRQLDAPFADVSLGSHGHRRGLLAASGGEAGMKWLAAAETAHHDGPWVVPEGLRRDNAVLGLSGGRGQDQLALTLMHYRARWTSTDQLPERALRDGRLGRFDSLDPTAGGRTARSSLALEALRQDGTSRTRLAAWWLAYRLDLFSNFTYALERPDDGDQFEQSDRRHAAGVELSRIASHELGRWPARSSAGLQWRQDRIDVGLHDTVARQRTATVREDRVRQTASAAWLQTEVEWSPWLRTVGGLRLDRLDARVEAISLPDNGGRSRGRQWSPRGSLVLGPFEGLLGGARAPTEFFLNAGRGLHSNDARGTTARTDPRSGQALAPVPVLVPSTGWELGARSEPAPGVQLSAALWSLRFASELVYVGDAGNTEAGPASRRHGLELSARWLPRPWLLLDADLAWSHARLADGSRIANAVPRVASLGAALRDLQGWSAGLSLRHLGPAPLSDDGLLRSRPSTTLNLRIARSLARGTELSLEVLNLADRRQDDIQYAYPSRLPGEPAAGVLDRHLHPALPRSLRLGFRVGY